VAAADAPVIFDFKVILKVNEEIITGHLATGEKVFGHPIVFALDLEMIGELTMSEDVNEELTAWL
jgi:hypothetical protein